VRGGEFEISGSNYSMVPVCLLLTGLLLTCRCASFRGNILGRVAYFFHTAEVAAFYIESFAGSILAVGSSRIGIEALLRVKSGRQVDMKSSRLMTAKERHGAGQ